ncbi:MAG: armadillo-type protein [Piptocephalis tieghemiana]|nr:MAG: armadillo-type protein [Piptocephalis tieghemiana]
MPGPAESSGSSNPFFSQQVLPACDKLVRSVRPQLRSTEVSGALVDLGNLLDPVASLSLSHAAYILHQVFIAREALIHHFSSSSSSDDNPYQAFPDSVIRGIARVTRLLVTLCPTLLKDPEVFTEVSQPLLLSLPKEGYTNALEIIQCLRSILPIPESSLDAFLHPLDPPSISSSFQHSITEESRLQVHMLLQPHLASSSSFQISLAFWVSRLGPFLAPSAPPKVIVCTAHTIAALLLFLGPMSIDRITLFFPFLASTLATAIVKTSPSGPGGRVPALTSLLNVLGALLEMVLSDMTTFDLARQEEQERQQRSGEQGDQRGDDLDSLLASLASSPTREDGSTSSSSQSSSNQKREGSPPAQSSIVRDLKWFNEVTARVHQLLCPVLSVSFIGQPDSRIRLPSLSLVHLCIARCAKSLRISLPQLVNVCLLATQDSNGEVRSLAWRIMAEEIRPRPEFLPLRLSLCQGLYDAIIDLPKAILGRERSKPLSSSFSSSMSPMELAKHITGIISALGEANGTMSEDVALAWPHALEHLPYALELGEEDKGPGLAGNLMVEMQDSNTSFGSSGPPARLGVPGTVFGQEIRFRWMDEATALCVGQAIEACSRSGATGPILSATIEALRSPQIIDSTLQGGCIWLSLCIIRGGLKGKWSPEKRDQGSGVTLSLYPILALSSQSSFPPSSSSLFPSGEISTWIAEEPEGSLGWEEVLGYTRAFLRECALLPNLTLPTSQTGAKALVAHRRESGLPPLPEDIALNPERNALVVSLTLLVMGELSAILGEMDPQGFLEEDLPPLLHPLLRSLGDTGCWGVQEGARRALRMVTLAAGYGEEPRSLLLDHVDYVMDEGSQRLIELRHDPSVTWMLEAVMGVAGPKVLPYIGDILEDILDALSRYRSSQYLRSRLVQLLSSLVDGVIRPGLEEELGLDNEGDDEMTRPRIKEKLGMKRRVVESIIQAISPSTPMKTRENEEREEEMMRVHEEGMGKEDEDAAIPRMIQSTPGTEEIGRYFLEKAWKNENGEEGEEEEEEEGGTAKEEKHTREEEESLPPLSRSARYAMNILQAMQHHLSAEDPNLRILALRTLSRAMGAFGGLRKPEWDAVLLPMAHETWTLLLPRLQEGESGGIWVRVEGYRLVGELCRVCGSFLWRRWEQDVWPGIRQALTKLEGPSGSRSVRMEGGGGDKALCKAMLQCVQHALGTLVKGKRLPAVSEEMALGIRPWLALGCSGSPEVVEGARKAMSALGQVDPDIVWVYLQGCGEEKDAGPTLHWEGHGPFSPQSLPLFLQEQRPFTSKDDSVVKGLLNDLTTY